MAQQNINIGRSANAGDGDPLRIAFDKINDNFDELYARALNTDAQTLTLNGNTLSISNGNSVELNISPKGDLTGSVFADDSSLIVDAVNNKLYAETLTTLAVFGNPTLSLNADVIALDAQNGNLTLQTTDTITNNFVNLWEVQGISASMQLTDDGVNSELGLNVDVVDFGTGNTVDMQGNSVLFDSASIQDFAPGNIYANSGQFLYVTGKHAGGTATNVAFTYDTSINNPRQTFYGKTQFGFNGQAPIVDFTGATFAGEPWISVTDLKAVVAASVDFDDFKARIAAL